MNEYGQYGALGAMVLSTFTAIIFLVKWVKKKDEDHASERREWLRSFEDIADKHDKTTRETNTIIRETSGILFGLKSLLEHQNRGK